MLALINTSGIRTNSERRNTMISNSLDVQKKGILSQQLHIAVDNSGVRDVFVGVYLVEADESGGDVRHRLADATEHARAAQARVEVEVLLREVRRHVDELELLAIGLGFDRRLRDWNWLRGDSDRDGRVYDL